MTEQPEWLSKYPDASAWWDYRERFGEGPMRLFDLAVAAELEDINKRVARLEGKSCGLEAGQRELEARLGDDGK